MNSPYRIKLLISLVSVLCAAIFMTSAAASSRLDASASLAERFAWLVERNFSPTGEELRSTAGRIALSRGEGERLALFLDGTNAYAGFRIRSSAQPSDANVLIRRGAYALSPGHGYAPAGALIEFDRATFVSWVDNLAVFELEGHVGSVAQRMFLGVEIKPAGRLLWQWSHSLEQQKRLRPTSSLMESIKERQAQSPLVGF